MKISRHALQVGILKADLYIFGENNKDWLLSFKCHFQRKSDVNFEELFCARRERLKV